MVTVGTADRFFDDLVDDAEFDNVLRCRLKRFCSLGAFRAVRPKDGSAPFGGDNGIHGMFQHQDPVSDRNGQSSAGATFTGDADDDGGAQARHFTQITGDGLGLTALFRANARIGAGGVNKGDDRQLELFRHLHKTERLAVAFRIWHAEIAVDLLLGIAPLLVADNHDRLAFEAGEAANYGVIIAKVPVAMKFDKLGEHEIDIVLGKGTVDMTGYLCGLPAGEVGKDIRPHLLHTPFKGGHISADVQAASCQRSKFLDFLFQLDDRLFKFKIKRGSHYVSPVKII